LKEKENVQEIDKLNIRIKEFENQNLLLKFEMERLKSRCANLSETEQQTTTELNSLKQTIQQMIEQYSDLDKKFSDNIKKLKFYEQRHVFIIFYFNLWPYLI
jgi:regulator of replication initiation timing